MDSAIVLSDNVQIHKLEAAEYPVLCQMDDGFKPDPQTSIALVAKQDGEFVGRIFLLAPVHLEGPWVRPDKRGGMVGKRLVDKAEEEARAIGVTKLFAFGSSEDLEDYLHRLGFKKQPLTVWAKEL